MTSSSQRLSGGTNRTTSTPPHGTPATVRRKRSPSAADGRYSEWLPTQFTSWALSDAASVWASPGRPGAASRARMVSRDPSRDESPGPANVDASHLSRPPISPPSPAPGPSGPPLHRAATVARRRSIRQRPSGARPVSPEPASRAWQADGDASAGRGGQRRQAIRRPGGQGPAAARRRARAPRGAGARRGARSPRPGSAADPRSGHTPGEGRVRSRERDGYTRGPEALRPAA